MKGAEGRAVANRARLSQPAAPMVFAAGTDLLFLLYEAGLLPDWDDVTEVRLIARADSTLVMQVDRVIPSTLTDLLRDALYPDTRKKEDPDVASV